MPAMLIRHTVADFAAWKPLFDKHGITWRANGSRGGWIFRSADDPNVIVILLEWDNLERARLFADSDDLREVLEWANVADRPDICFLADGDRTQV
jgi:hypothetical protein